MKNIVKNYYGKILKKSSDLKTNACCTIKKYPKIEIIKVRVGVKPPNLYFGVRPCKPRKK